MNKEYSIQFAQTQDLDSWMRMIEIVKDNFPGLKTLEQFESYRQTVIKNINRETAICVKKLGQVVGVLIFSYNSKCLSCMAVHPDHRKKGIASAMITKMLELFPDDVDISVTTFIEGDVKGIAPRPLYKKFGFVEDELVEEFNYPHQRFVLHRKL
ncbi:GNAT family N-acetyltransferase [Oceanirhabdus sp. W0125-5]|uniref:GNAT family N-acetyltransferase n=1 Tax=Oceanirhabdus sp. W0125-5 TaxID=2999116 RepID=UPI0022F2BD91|nr:GNAT family N-acetyltransferase [Oceanirhabdus sp. W0125-5]WBW96810.1 GNAT family N-acetyltransferase [Oceanirhabdus sp. W0125-5]